MRNKIWRRAGRLIFIITWPGIWLILKLTPARTRILVIHGDRLLLVKDWLGSGKWKLPGGGLHKNEDSIHGAIRELNEEVSILTTPNKLIHLASFKSSSNKINTNIHAYILMLAKRPKVSCQQLEISDYTWCKLDDIDQDKLSLTTQTALKHFNNRSKFAKIDKTK